MRLLMNEDGTINAMKASAWALSGIFLAKMAQAAISDDEKNTVNYELWDKGELVYHGISYQDRVETRFDEHEESGKDFDEVVVSAAKPRTKALRLEKRLIRRDQPAYNIQNNR